MASYYDQWLQGPEAQQLKSNYSSSLGDSVRTDETGRQFTVGGGYGNEGAGATMNYLDQWQPDSPYTSGKQWNSSDLSFEGASDMGLFGLPDARFGQSLRNTYSQFGKSDSDIVHGAQQALQQHVGTFGQGYDRASSFGGINDQIAQNLGVDLNGFDFKSLPGFSDAAAQARGDADRRKNYSGNFGQGNLLSSVLSYESDRVGDMAQAYAKDPERVNLGISTPLESSVWGAALGKKYEPTVDMYGGDTKKEQQNYAEKGGDSTEGAMVHTAARSIVGGSAGQAGYGNYVAAGSQGNNLQQGQGFSSNNLVAAAPALISAGSNYAGSGNQISGSYDTQTQTGDPGNDTLTNNTGNSSGGNTMYDDYGNPLDMSNPGGGGDPSYGGNNNDPSYMYDGSGNYATAPGAVAPDFSGGGMSLQDMINYAQKGYGYYNQLKGPLGLVGKIAQTGLGVAGSRSQQQQLQSQANQYADMGAPYRARLASMYNDPSSFFNSAQVQIPVQQGTDMLARSLSMRGGNPIGSGNSLQALQNYASGQLFGQFGNEANRLANFGGLSQFNAAAPGAQTNAIGAGAGVYNALGAGVSDIFNPQPSLAQTMAEYKRLSSAGV